MNGAIPDSAWPRNWFEPPQIASESGITSFRQSPILDSLVAAGELPSVEERLPEDPIVSVPYGQIGTYGGTASIFEPGVWILNPTEGPYRVGPQLKRNLPNLAARSPCSVDGG